MTEQLQSIYEMAQEFFRSNPSAEDLLNYAKQQYRIIKEGDCEYFLDKEGKKEILLSYTGTEERFVVPEGVKGISPSAFANNKYLKEIVLPNTLEAIAPKTFFNCTNLEEVSFPKSLKYVGFESFQGCSKIRQLTFPKTLERIMESAFLDCQSLEKITFLNNSIYIDADAFKNTRVWNINFKTSEKIPADIIKKLKEIYSPLAITIYDTPCSKIWESARTEKDFIDKLHEGNPLLFRVDEEISNLLNAIHPQIDFNEFEGTPLLKQYTAEEKKNLIYYCNISLQEVFKKIDRDKIISDVFGKMNYENFVSNMKHAIDVGFTPEEIGDIIANGNLNLLSTNIENAFSNYQWLVNQKLLTEEVLDKLFFNGEKIRDIQGLKYYYDKNKKLPELFNSLLVDNSNKNLQELKDKLVYISTLELLDGDTEKREKAKEIIKKSLFQSIVEYDKQKIKRINPNFTFSNKPKEFDGIYTILQRKMSGIDSSWFSDFFNMIYTDKEEFEKFLNSLNTKKEWDNFSSEKERAEFLKNEIIARLLYADLSIFVARNQRHGVESINDENIVDEYRKARSRRSSGEFPTVKQLIHYITENKITLFSESNIVKAMLTIDPYSFDALREINIDNVTQQSIELQYVKDADNNGYYLSDDIRKKYQELTNRLGFKDRKEKTFIEYLCNRIDIPINNSKIIDKLEESIRVFVQSSDLDELYNICNIFDFHLRHSKEYDVCTLQGNDFAKDSKIVFDRNSQEFSTESEMPRVLYCLFNLNKLSKHNYDLKVKKWDEMRLNGPNQRDRYFKKVDRYRRDIEILDRNGISTNLLSEYYKSYQSRNGNENKIKRANKMISRIQKDYAVTIPKDLMLEIVDLYDSHPNKKDFDQYLSSKVQNDSIVSTLYEECKATKAQEYMLMSSLIMYSLGISDTPQNSPIKETIADIFDLIEMYPEDLKDIEIAANEQRIAYVCKHLFSKYAMSRFGLLSQETIIDSVKLSKEEKINRFKDLGYAVEVQKDESGELVLACYCKGITDSFCVHLKDVFDDSIVTKLKDSCDPSNYLIATTQIPDRLRLIGSENAKIDITTCNKDGPWTGFNPATGLPAEQAMQLRNDVAYKNADTFGVVDFIDKNPTPTAASLAEEAITELNGSGQITVENKAIY